MVLKARSSQGRDHINGIEGFWAMLNIGLSVSGSAEKVLSLLLAEILFALTTVIGLIPLIYGLMSE